MRGAVNKLETRAECNACRYRDGDTRGHYESYFQRANHPSRPLAFWIRYTLLSPRGRAEDAVGELWAIYFDGERGRIAVATQREPLAACAFSNSELAVRIGSATLEQDRSQGAAQGAAHRIGWSLRHGTGQAPLLLLPPRLYQAGFPKAKSLVGTPNARFDGALEIDGTQVEVDDWVGSQNHNWGERHTARYAWAQVAGFDDEPDAFLECASARVQLGPVTSKLLTLLVLRTRGEELRLNGLLTAAAARARIDGLELRAHSAAHGLRVTLHVHGPREAFVALRYGDPPGGHKLCLNTKLAACELRLERRGEPARVLVSRRRAALELLGGGGPPDIPPSA